MQNTKSIIDLGILNFIKKLLSYEIEKMTKTEDKFINSWSFLNVAE